MPLKDIEARREFDRNRNKSPERKARFKTPEHRAYQRAWRKKYYQTPKGKETLKRLSKNQWNKPGAKEKFWKRSLKYKFNITYEKYYELFNKQNGACAICLKPQLHQRLAVDHNRLCCPGDKCCGKCVRGLLCEKCNIGIGFFNDSVGILKEAINYIEKYTVLVR